MMMFCSARVFVACLLRELTAGLTKHLTVTATAAPVTTLEMARREVERSGQEKECEREEWWRI